MAALKVIRAKYDPEYLNEVAELRREFGK